MIDRPTPMTPNPRKTVADVLIAKAREIAVFNVVDRELRATISDGERQNAELRREVGCLSRQLASELNRPMHGPPDRLTAAIDAQWSRLAEDYRSYRRAVGYPHREVS
ncbi:hypothetical protein JNB88_23610 [Rhizobium cauense]|uniref:hypothetical protein n=1 Tax=Rhizobium cauense TaxID=1166683 RepID=UPI001C6EED2E|nr:hypothetical protein [Rhizobium cauense]MBW9116624.1 hypothetical protein [Rhizobium cauense]